MANLSFKRTIESPVNSSSAYNDTDKITFGFMAHRIQCHYRSGTNEITFSTNGTDDAVALGPDVGDMQSFEILEPSTEIWWKGGSGDEVIEILAFSQY